MKKYVIEITRITYATETVEVEANDEHEAIVQAEDLSKDIDFYTDNVEYEYDVVYYGELTNGN